MNTFLAQFHAKTVVPPTVAADNKASADNTVNEDNKKTSAPSPFNPWNMLDKFKATTPPAEPEKKAEEKVEVQPAKEEVKPEVVVEEEQEEAPKAPEFKPDKPEEVVVKETVKKTEEPEQSNKKAEATTADDNNKQEEQKAEEAKAEPVKKEAPKKKTRKTAKKKVLSDAPKTVEKTEKVEAHYAYEASNIDVFGMSMSFKEANSIIMGQYVDQEWLDEQSRINKKLADIKISQDMNPGTLKYAIEELNILNDEIAFPLEEAKALIMTLSDKESGIGTVIKTTAAASAEGTAIDRAAAGFRALSHVDVNGNEVNLLAVLTAAKIKFSFYESIRNRIEYKSKALITMNGALKLENDLSKY